MNLNMDPVPAAGSNFDVVYSESDASLLFNFKRWFRVPMLIPQTCKEPAAQQEFPYSCLHPSVHLGRLVAMTILYCRVAKYIFPKCWLIISFLLSFTVLYLCANLFSNSSSGHLFLVQMASFLYCINSQTRFDCPFCSWFFKILLNILLCVQEVVTHFM